MEDKYTIIMFLKFGRKEDILDLYENGTIYMNSIQHFRSVEDGNVRGDSYEGVSSIMNSLPGHFEVSGIKINYISIHLPKSFQTVFGNIYSLYCISSHGFKTPNDFFIDEKVKEFGNYVLLINSPGEFLGRIEAKLKLTGLKYKLGFVEYYNTHTINGEIHLFQKSNAYEYQKEFRLYVERDQITPFVFQIGTLKDIADVYPTNIIRDMKFT